MDVVRSKVTGSWLIALITILDAGKFECKAGVKVSVNRGADLRILANSCWFGYDQVRSPLISDISPNITVGGR